MLSSFESANECRTIPFKCTGFSVSHSVSFSLAESHAYATLDIRPAIVLLNTQISTADYRLDRIAYSKLNCVFARIGWLDKSFDLAWLRNEPVFPVREHRCERIDVGFRGLKTRSAKLQKSPIVVLQFAKCVVWQESVAVPSERVVCYERNKCADGVKPLASGPDESCPNIGLPTVNIERVRIETEWRCRQQEQGHSRSKMGDRY